MKITPRNIFLLLPVENQVRELDPKLLLACMAASRGFPAVIGSRREIEMHIGRFPRSIYISKGLKSGNGRFFKLLRRLGHRVVAWDEEAFVHLPQEIYFSRRLSTVAMRNLDHLFAWGPDNAALWRAFPGLPETTPIHLTGNPRGDLLRPELRSFYREDAERIRRRHGEFILVNTNFNHVNAFSPFQNLFKPTTGTDGQREFGEAGKGMTRDYAEGLERHKQSIFRAFQALIPWLESAIPEVNFVVRPHPTENPEIYHRLAADAPRIEVTNEGNIVPWLMAARGLIHNGCTTGVEAYLMGVPAVSYRAAIDSRYDDGFYGLPNQLSHQCFSTEELAVTLKRVLSGEIGVAEGKAREDLIDQFLSARTGHLACARVVAVIEQMVGGQSELPATALQDRMSGWFKLQKRRWKKRAKSYLPNSINRPEFQRRRYPGVTLAEVQRRCACYRDILGLSCELTVVQVHRHFFRIEARASG